MRCICITILWIRITKLKEHYKNEMFETNLSLDELFRNKFDTQKAYFDKTERKVMRHYLVLGYLAHIAYVFGEAEVSDVCIEVE